MIRLLERYENIIFTHSHRLLTLAARNVDSPMFGCFDRDWWHYKIRDFPSIILQQGAYTLLLISPKILNNVGISHSEIEILAEGAVKFWSDRAHKKGAFEEYYPYEQGYPPLAFSTLAIIKIMEILNSNSLKEQVLPALELASKQLINRFEKNAANQQVAGLAALVRIYKYAPELVDRHKLEALSNRTLSLQDKEGWFIEYDGADIGYLSVTMDCIYDIYDVLPDSRWMTALEKSLKFLHYSVVRMEKTCGPLNSRNTDYIVPYSLVRLYLEGGVNSQIYAQDVLHKIIENDNFLSIDDRYISHYIGHSIVRAYNLLDTSQLKTITKRKKTINKFDMPNTGYYDLSHNKHLVTVGGNKGGVLSILFSNGSSAIDYGWSINVKGKKYTTYWYSQPLSVEKNITNITIITGMFRVKEFISTPGKHILLRIISYFFGIRIILFLKSIMIFKKSDPKIQFKREVKVLSDQVLVLDEISVPHSVSLNDLMRATKHSARHVASADTFLPFDNNTSSIEMNANINRTSKRINIKTIYRPKYMSRIP
jgi:hypothetical protein